jgi:hypothetical protein
VDFIIVGMTAGVLQGAPVTTVDVDIVYRRGPDTVTRLLHGPGFHAPGVREDDARR